MNIPDNVDRFTMKGQTEGQEYYFLYVYQVLDKIMIFIIFNEKMLDLNVSQHYHIVVFVYLFSEIKNITEDSGSAFIISYIPLS